ncbi:MAG: NAD(P)-dependent oxidoreductase [Spirochaetes bacterium]|nr:NAD(P)-dependent oxidoreductase [Spirochaetota bacterium]
MPEKIVLVTGGAGYIGSRLCEALLKAGYIVHCLDNLMYGQTSLLHLFANPKFKFIYGDVTDIRLLQKHVEYADIIFPLAGIVGMPACKKHPELARAVNYTHIYYILKVIKPTQKIIYPNTNSGYGIGIQTDDGKAVYCDEETILTPISEYGITKMMAEEDVLKHGGVVFRLATVFGPSARMRLDLLVNDFVYRAVNDGSIVLFESHFKRNFIHIGDVVSAFLMAIEKYDTMGGEVYNLGLSSANMNKMELCEKIKEQVTKFAIIESDLFEDPDKRNYIVSNKKIESMGFRPLFTIERGIRELIEMYNWIIPINHRFGNQ